MSLTGESQITLSELLHKLIEMGGSDLHLRVNSPPQVRIHGLMQPLAGYHPLTPSDTKHLAYSVLSDTQKKLFEKKLELDFSIGLDEQPMRVETDCRFLWIGDAMFTRTSP